jgi:hypothetical protein
LEIKGFEAAEEVLSRKDPREQELYVVLERARARLRDITVNELIEARDSKERLEILRGLQSELETVIENVDRVPRLKSMPGGKAR